MIKIDCEVKSWIDLLRYGETMVSGVTYYKISPDRCIIYLNDAEYENISLFIAYIDFLEKIDVIQVNRIHGDLTF